MGPKMSKRVLMEERGIEPRTFRKQCVMQLNIIRTFSFVKGVSNGWLTADILPLNHSPTFSKIAYNVKNIIIIFDDPVSVIILRLSRFSGILTFPRAEL